MLHLRLLCAATHLNGKFFTFFALDLNYVTSKRCRWVKSFISRGSVGIKANDFIEHYFQTHKGYAKVTACLQYYLI
jgi:hypothetical protein